MNGVFTLRLAQISKTVVYSSRARALRVTGGAAKIMGIQQFPAKMLGKVPTYYITETIQEDAGGGNVRIMNYARVRGVLVPQFECIVASVKLVTVSRNLTDIAQEVAKAEQLRMPDQHVH